VRTTVIGVKRLGGAALAQRRRDERSALLVCDTTSAGGAARLESQLIIELADSNSDTRLTRRPPAIAGVTQMSLSKALALGPDAWDALGERGTSPSPFMSWAWHRAWSSSAPLAEVDATRVLLLHGSDSSVQAVLPVRMCRFRFHRVWVPALNWAIGETGCPDQLDVLALPEANIGSLAAAIEAIPWQVIILDNLAEGAPNAERLCAALAARGHAIRRSPLWCCPRLELPSSWDAYLATLSATRRQTLRRTERRLFRDHTVAVVDYEGDRLEEGWSHLMRLHEQRWNNAGGGAFRDPRAERLQRQFAGEMAKQKRLWLTTLDVDGQPAAAWYGFSSGDTVYFYQSGRDPRWGRERVGMVLMGMMIHRAIRQGYRAFDFLRGDDSYKQQWTPARRNTSETVIIRSGWRRLWLRALDSVAAFRQGIPRDA
jgi:GNAT acetyltransferase-like protein